MLQVSLTASGRLALHFEKHSVTLPFTAAGFECLRRVLIARAMRRKGYATNIGTPAQPTQWDIEQWLKAHQPKVPTDLNIEVDL